jgi:hypothetical protein
MPLLVAGAADTPAHATPVVACTRGLLRRAPPVNASSRRAAGVPAAAAPPTSAAALAATVAAAVAPATRRHRPASHWRCNAGAAIVRCRDLHCKAARTTAMRAPQPPSCRSGRAPARFASPAATRAGLVVIARRPDILHRNRNPWESSP